jgi:hypothetical protein
MIRRFLPNIAAAVADLYLCLLELLRLKLMLRVSRRRADETFAVAGRTRLMRWYLLPRNPFLNVCLHYIVASDPAAEFHGHRWGYATLLLRGAYTEYRDGREPVRLRSGSLAFRSGRTRHRVELSVAEPTKEYLRVWSLIVTGPVSSRPLSGA